jgi:hypothetical protein
MLDRDEVVRSLTGAWELFLDRPDALRRFDISVRGFWRSFSALLLLAPLYALASFAEREAILSDPLSAATYDDTLFVLDRAFALVTDWVTLPVILALIAGRIGIARTYPAFIVARNWGAVLSMLPFGLIGLAMGLGWIDGEAAQILSLAGLFLVLRYSYLIARRAMEVPVAFAIAVVIGDFLLSLAIAASVDAVFGQ